MRSKLIFILFFVYMVIANISITEAERGFSDKPRKDEKIMDEDWVFLQENIEQNLFYYAQTKNLIFTPEAINVMTKEMISWKGYGGVLPFQIEISNSEYNEFIDKISIAASGQIVTASIASAAIVDDKVNSVVKVWLPNVITHAEISGIKLTEGAFTLFQDDLLDQTRMNAMSGLPIQEIYSRNDWYVKEVFSLTPTVNLDEDTYVQICYSLFKQHSKLTIHSIPSGASVEIRGIQIGQTTISEKPFESDKWYTFVFKLNGYKVSEREYFVNSKIPKDEFTEILIKE